jgi:hypothetical protein
LIATGYFGPRCVRLGVRRFAAWRPARFLLLFAVRRGGGTRHNAHVDARAERGNSDGDGD